MLRVKLRIGRNDSGLGGNAKLVPIHARVVTTDTAGGMLLVAANGVGPSSVFMSGIKK